MSWNEDESTRQRSKASEEAAHESGQGGRLPTKADKETRKRASAAAGRAGQARPGKRNEPVQQRVNAGQDAPRVGGRVKRPGGRGTAQDRESDGLGGRAPTGPSGRKAPSGTSPRKRRSPGAEGATR